jgi:hypothetical protein
MSVVVKLFMRIFSPVRRSDAEYRKNKTGRRDAAVVRSVEGRQAKQTDRRMTIKEDMHMSIFILIEQ